VNEAPSRAGRGDGASTRSAERGAALLTVMLVMFGVLGLGVTALWLTTGNLHVASNLTMRSRAFYCAEAGIERARAFLNTAPAGGVSAFLTTNMRGTTAAGDNVPTALDATTGRPNGVGAIVVDAAGALLDVPFPNGFAASPGGLSAPAPGRYTVWLRNDTAEYRRGNFATDTNGAAVIRSQCVAPDGRTTVVLEATFSPPRGDRIPILVECLDSGKNVDEANTNTVHCSRN
jgi:hypothetical protein